MNSIASLEIFLSLYFSSIFPPTQSFIWNGLVSVLEYVYARHCSALVVALFFLRKGPIIILGKASYIQIQISCPNKTEKTLNNSKITTRSMGHFLQTTFRRSSHLHRRHAGSEDDDKQQPSRQQEPMEENTSLKSPQGPPGVDAGIWTVEAQIGRAHV